MESEIEQLIRKLQEEIKKEGSLYEEGDAFDVHRDQRQAFIPEPWLHYEHPLRGSGRRNRKAVLFLKKLIRKCIRFLLVPILDEQSGFNYSVKTEITRLGRLAQRQEDRIEKLEAGIRELEDRPNERERHRKELS